MMMKAAPVSHYTTPITSKDQLIAYFQAGCKPDRNDWRIGTEHEKFGFYTKDLSPVPYAGEAGIEKLLYALQARTGGVADMEGAHIIGVTLPNGGSISLEPGGQLELSGAPLKTVHETCSEVNGHLKDVKAVATEMGIGMLGVGFAPTWKLQDVPIMPKGRYKIMRDYMAKVGTLGRDMMFRTCTVQVNLDFGDEADMVRKLRLSLALQPVATAMFANSPFTEGKPNGYMSYRGHIWTDTDRARSGNLPFVFEQGFGFERYVDYLLDVPMYFVKRNGKYIDVAGQSFRDFMRGELPGFEGQLPMMSDWLDHMTTSFPDVRLKQYLEMRGADGGQWRRICSLPAFWVGLLYDDTALAEAEGLVADWSQEERGYLVASVPKLALKTQFRGQPLVRLASELIEISARGLARRAINDGYGDSEEVFLADLRDIIKQGHSPAQRLLNRYHNEWDQDITKLFTEMAFY